MYFKQNVTPCIKKTGEPGEKTVTGSVCPSQIPQGLVWDRIWASSDGPKTDGLSQRTALTAKNRIMIFESPFCDLVAVRRGPKPALYSFRYEQSNGCSGHAQTTGSQWMRHRACWKVYLVSSAICTNAKIDCQLECGRHVLHPEDGDDSRACALFVLMICA